MKYVNFYIRDGPYPVYNTKRYTLLFIKFVFEGVIPYYVPVLLIMKWNTFWQQSKWVKWLFKTFEKWNISTGPNSLGILCLVLLIMKFKHNAVSHITSWEFKSNKIKALFQLVAAAPYVVKQTYNILSFSLLSLVRVINV